VQRTRLNLERVADALVELHAHLRVTGLSDAEMAALPLPIDAETLARSELSTWRTDAGDVDILADIPGPGGARRRYEELIEKSHRLEADGVEVRSADLDDVLESKRWANRSKDREALPELEELARRRRLAE